MNDNDIRHSRRRALKLIGGGVALIPLASLTRTAAGQGEMVKVAEDDPAAVALGYKHDATAVDVEKYPRKAGDDGAKQKCSTCVLFQGTGESGWGGCSIFPGKQVNAGGWCSAWAPKA